MSAGTRVRPSEVADGSTPRSLTETTLRAGAIAGPEQVGVSGQGAVRLGHDGFEHREINRVEIVDVDASDAGGMRSQVLELQLVSSNAVG